MRPGRVELRSALYSLLGAAASFTFSVLVARSLDSVARGEFLAMQLPVTLLMPLAVVGSGQAAVYYIAARPSDARSYAKSALLVSAAASGIIALGCSLVVLLTVGDLVWVSLFWYLPSFAILGVIANLHRAHGHFETWSRIRVGATAAPVVGLPLLWVVGLRGLPLVVASMIGPTAAAVAVAWWRSRRLVADGAASIEAVRDLVRYGVPGMASVLLNGLNRRADQLILAAVLVGSADLGSYAVAAGYSAVAFALATSIGQPTAVAVARLQPADRPARARKVVRMASAPLLAGAVLAAGGAFIVIEPVFGERYASAIVPAAILTVAAGIYGEGSVIAEMLRAMRRPGDVVVGEMVGLVAQVALLALLVPRYSIAGAALSSLGGYVLATATLFALLRRTPRLAPVPAPAPSVLT